MWYKRGVEMNIFLIFLLLHLAQYFLLLEVKKGVWRYWETAQPVKVAFCCFGSFCHRLSWLFNRLWGVFYSFVSVPYLLRRLVFWKDCRIHSRSFVGICLAYIRFVFRAHLFPFIHNNLEFFNEIRSFYPFRLFSLSSNLKM